MACCTLPVWLTLVFDKLKVLAGELFVLYGCFLLLYFSTAAFVWAEKAQDLSRDINEMRRLKIEYTYSHMGVPFELILIS